MNKIKLLVALMIWLFASASMMAQSVNMNRYITLTVKNGEAIRLYFKAAADDTPIRIVSGSNTKNITVGTDWTNIAYYTANASTMTVYGDIIGLDCHRNSDKITALDVSKNTQLAYLECPENNINSLDLSNNTQLTWLSCSDNLLTALDVSKNTQLTYLDCSLNELSTLDVSKNTLLTWLSCSKNHHISTLDVSNNTKLTYLTCYSNKLNSIDVSKNTQLAYLYFSDNQVSSLDLSNNTKLKNLVCSHNQISSLDLSKNTKLILLSCFSNDISSLDVSKNTLLENLDCSYNKLSSLDVSKNTLLEELNCSDNQISSLEISNNRDLKQLDCSYNKISSLDVFYNRQLRRLDCYHNNLSRQVLDNIFCDLPNRGISDFARIFPLNMSSSWTEQDMVKATTASNATAKNWKVQKYISGENHTDITTTGSYVCGSGGATTYDLKIAGTNVTSDNCNDLSVISGVSGTVKYDPTTKTLTLQEATINATGNGNNAINSNIDDLTININGTNNLSSSKVVIATNKSLTITGNGATLNVQSETDCGILVAKKYLMIDDCTVNAKGKYGFSGLNSLSEVLYIRNATVTAEGEECGSIVNFKSLMLEGCAITEPTGAAFDASKKAVVLGGEIVKSKVVISKNTSGISEATAEKQLTLYPNPASEELYLSTTAHSIHIYNMYGTEVLRATDTDRIAVSHLPAGVYTVKADSTVVKMEKR